MEVNLLLVASENNNQKEYIALLQNLGVSITAAASFTNLDETISKNFFHGLLVDFNTRFKAVKENRALVYRMMEKFPVALLRLDRGKKTIKAFYNGSTRRILLEEFIEKKCRPFNPRRFRYHPRKALHFNVILSREASIPAKEREFSFTLDVSRGGCFAFSSQKWTTGDTVWMVANELRDKTPIRGIVRHTVPWGSELSAPGIGVEIEEITESQKAQLEKEYGL